MSTTRHKDHLISELTSEEKEMLLDAWADSLITTDEMTAMRQEILDARYLLREAS